MKDKKLWKFDLCVENIDILGLYDRIPEDDISELIEILMNYPNIEINIYYYDNTFDLMLCTYDEPVKNPKRFNYRISKKEFIGLVLQAKLNGNEMKWDLRGYHAIDCWAESNHNYSDEETTPVVKIDMTKLLE